MLTINLLKPKWIGKYKINPIKIHFPAGKAQFVEIVGFSLLYDRPIMKTRLIITEPNLK